MLFLLWIKRKMVSIGSNLFSSFKNITFQEMFTLQSLEKEWNWGSKTPSLYSFLYPHEGFYILMRVFLSSWGFFYPHEGFFIVNSHWTLWFNVNIATSHYDYYGSDYKFKKLIDLIKATMQWLMKVQRKRKLHRESLVHNQSLL